MADLILNERDRTWTARQLFASTVQVSDTRKNYSSSANQKFRKLVPYVMTNSALFQFVHRGLTTKTEHAVNLMFFQLDVTKEIQSKDKYIKTLNKGGNVVYVEKPDVKKTPIRVRCSCVDFYFTFAYWDWKNDALFGPKPRPYKRKTTNRKPRNPGKYPGFCKHIYNSIVWMQNSGYTQAKR